MKANDIEKGYCPEYATIAKEIINAKKKGYGAIDFLGGYCLFRASKGS
ncbi:MAG: hypothetical protein ACTSYQ_00350 [Candidatus Odinarchaeia archaeon]